MYHSLFHNFTSSFHEILYLVILSWVSLSTAKQETDKPICNPAQILKISTFVITVVIITGQFAIREGPPPTLKSLESRPPGSIEPHLSPQHPWLDKRATWAVHPSVPAMSGHPSQALDPMSVMIIHLHQHHIQHPHDYHLILIITGRGIPCGAGEAVATKKWKMIVTNTVAVSLLLVILSFCFIISSNYCIISLSSLPTAGWSSRIITVSKAWWEKSG